MQRPGILVGGVAVAGVHAALHWIHHVPAAKALLGDEGTYLRVATRIAAGDDPALPLLWPPLYPHFVAAVFRLTNDSLLALQLVQTALLVGVAFLGRDVVRRLMGPGPPAECVFWGTLAYPPLVAFAQVPRPEILFLFFFASALWILAARRESAWGCAGLGVALGLAQLTKSLLAPFVPVLLLPLALDGTTRDRVLRPAIAVAALLVVLAPTLLENRARHGEAFVANSAWFNLWVGLNDTSRRNLRQPVAPREYRRFEESAPDFATRNALLRERIALRVREKGAVAIARDQLGRQYFRLLDKDSYLTDQLPGGVVAARGAGFADPPAVLAAVLRLGSFAAYALVLVGAALGIALCPPAGRRWMWVALAFLAYHVAIFALLHVKSRFRVPMLPFLFFYAGCALDALRRHEARAGAPLAAGAAGAALLLFLAFGGAYLD